jgi:phage terminase Nu1 subunit (DNA packaging protein)
MAKFESGDMIVGTIQGQVHNYMISWVSSHEYGLDNGVGEFSDSIENIEADFELCSVVDDRRKRMQALADYLAIEPDPIEGETLEDYIEQSAYDSEEFEAEGNTYLVLTDAEADDRAKYNVADSLWAFNADYLTDYIPLPANIISLIQREMSEDCNEAFKELLGDKLDSFIDDAISADGRAHFMNTYDDQENTSSEYLIYRTN